ncbi:hypothetical protein N665_0172s0050 [Sinapis alba]|nr:hypothetical protein N665_0172s0050 [Sinapis alba]
MAHKIVGTRKQKSGSNVLKKGMWKNTKLLLQDIHADLGFNKLFTAEPLGKRSVDVVFSNNQMIDVKAVINGINVYTPFVYGVPVLEKKRSNCPCFLIGDFNEIRGHHDKEKAKRRSDTSFLSFNQMILDCGMLEFPCTGNQLSWTGKRTNGNVRCHLDRALRNNYWHEKKGKSSKFDKRWLDIKEIRKVILDGWNSSELSPNANIMDHISSFEDLNSKVDNLYSDDDDTTKEIGTGLKELTEALKAEERSWKQKNKVFWLKEGDLNTKFFHAITKQRRAINKITGLLDSDGNLLEDEEKLVVIATNYFKDLFATSNLELVQEALANVTTTIFDQLKADFTSPDSE